MSFAEQNKAWLLPLLGLGVLGVIWMNFQMLGSKPAPAPALPAPSGPAPVPVSASRGEGIVAPGRELWADLRVLDEPNPKLSDAAALLKRAEAAADWTLAARTAVLHPERWPRTAPIQVQASLGPGLRPSGPPALPSVVFVARTQEGPVAWIDQRPCRVGDVLAGGLKIQSIAFDRVRFLWEGQTLERPVLPQGGVFKEVR